MRVVPPRSERMGHAQAIAIGADGVLTAAADPAATAAPPSSAPRLSDLGRFAERGRSCSAELTTRWIKRSAHRSVRDLVASIRTWITAWNEAPRPYVWHKTADGILDSLPACCQRINDSGHC